jgi:membrane protease YdiL (CAAX protease family)
MDYLNTVFHQIFFYLHAYSNVSFALGLLIFGFPGYYIFTSSMRNRYFNLSNKDASYPKFIIQRITGFIFYGLIPLFFFYYFQPPDLQHYGFNLNNLPQSLIWIGIFMPPILLINYFNASREINLRNYPQIRIRQWSFLDLSINFFTWFLYLFAYELFFRGFLLFSLYGAFGLTTAVTLNIILYALVHIPKGRKEMIGSLPFGLVLCLITLDTGSIFAAFMLHGMMAVTCEFFSIRANPEMTLIKKRL